MSDANPEKKARSKVVQAELNSCRDRLRLLEEGKVRRAEAMTWVKLTSLDLLEWWFILDNN
jgi:hypothetical protein